MLHEPGGSENEDNMILHCDKFKGYNMTMGIDYLPTICIILSAPFTLALSSVILGPAK